MCCLVPTIYVRAASVTHDALKLRLLGSCHQLTQEQNTRGPLCLRKAVEILEQHPRVACSCISQLMVHSCVVRQL